MKLIENKLRVYNMNCVRKEMLHTLTPRYNCLINFPNGRIRSPFCSLLSVNKHSLLDD